MTASGTAGKETLPSATSLVLSAFHVTIKNASVLYGYAAWLLLPLFLLFIPLLIPGSEQVSGLLEQVSYFVLSMWATSAIIITLTLTMNGKVIPEKRVTSLGLYSLERTPHLMWATIATIVLTTLGSVLFVIPGIVIAVYMAFVRQEIVIEGVGLIEAMKRGRETVRGQFFPVLWRLFVGAVVFGGTTFALTFFVVSLFAAGLEDSQATAFLANPPIALTVLISLISTAIAPFVLSYQTLLYFAVKKS